MSASLFDDLPPVFAACGVPGCDWSQCAESLDDGWHLCDAHGADAHGDKPQMRFFGTSGQPISLTPLRPNAVDSMLAYPEHYLWRAE